MIDMSNAIERKGVTKAAGVYRIIDTEHGMFYFGSAVSLRARCENHAYHLIRGTHSNKILSRVWGKRKERLRFEVIALMPDSTRDMRMAAEQTLLDKANVLENDLCMNILPNARSCEGVKRSDAVKEKMSAAQRGRTVSDETRRRMSVAKIGKKQSQETVQKRAKTKTGAPCNRPLGIINENLRALSKDQVISARLMRSHGASWRELSIEFGLAMGTIKRAVTGITYKDVIDDNA